MNLIIETNGFKMILISNYGNPGYAILRPDGTEMHNYLYQGSRESALKRFKRIIEIELGGTYDAQSKTND